MSSRVLQEKIIKKKVKNLIKNYVLTVINNKNDINQNLYSEDLSIILSSGNGRKKRIFSKLSIFNTCFEAKTYSKKNVEKFEELKNLIDPLDEEGIYPFNEFEEIEFDFLPKLKRGLQLNLSSFEFKEFQETEEIKTFEQSFFNSKYDNKNLLCIYTTKLNGKRHKFKKFIELVDKVLDDKKKFFALYKKIIFIFEIKSLDQIEEEMMQFPEELREVNNSEDYPKFTNFSILFNIKEENDDNSPSYIFTNNDFGKTFYFILDPDNVVLKAKSLHYPDSLVKELINEEDNSDINSNVIDKTIFNNLTNEEILEQKIKSFYEFYDFLINIKKARYYFYLSYHFNLILKYSHIEDKLLIKDIFFTRFNGDFRPAEYNKLKEIISIFNPEMMQFKEIEALDIDIDFSDMTCCKCSQKIKDKEELFYCYICKNKYCFSCVKNHVQKNNGKSKFIDPMHNLIFFKTRDKNDLLGIDKYKMGKNIFSNTSEENLGRFKKVQCDGCGIQFATSVRYICLTCLPGLTGNSGFKDFCQTCIEHMMADDQKGRDLQSIKMGIYNTEIFLLDDDDSDYITHDHKRHIYLMVPLACNEEENPYYDY